MTLSSYEKQPNGFSHIETQPSILSPKTSWEERWLYLRARDTAYCPQPPGGVVPINAYMGKFHTKGVPFAGFRYMKSRDFT